MKSVFCFLALFLVLASHAQTHTPRYISMSNKTKAYYEYLPLGYDAAGPKRYPLILFMTGIGEFGSGSAAALPSVLKLGVPKEINNGTFPVSFTANNEEFRFIVITPQFIKYPRPEAQDMDTVLNYIVSHYNVDTTRIYITGLSYGGGLSFSYAGHSNTFSKRVAAIVPVASPVPDGGDSTIYVRSRVIASNNVAVWATHNRLDHDDTVATTISYITDINLPPAPTPQAKMTIFNASGHNAWDRTYTPTFKENDKNIYEWMLQYRRTPAVANKPPAANAGADQTLTLPTANTTLTGTGTDLDGTIAGYSWAKVSGPAGGNISSVTTASTSVTGLQEGSYVFRLTVTDNSGATASDDVTIVVNRAPNVAPSANAGADQTITLPAVASLTGSGIDTDGSIASYAWTKISGPTGGTVTSPTAAATTVTNLSAGTYIFRLTVTDNLGATGFDDISILVKPAPNQPPQANAGADQTITLPTTTISLNGTATDADGTVTTLSWTKVSGPAGSTIVSPNAAATSITGLQEGSYVFRFTVTDNSGATAFDDVTITLNRAPNVAPKANAGPDQTITLPASLSLTGSGTDADGTIASYAWTKISGPASGNITSASTANTTVTNLAVGAYVFRLTITDNSGATAFDEATVTVNAAPNVAPTANAGADQNITLPVSSATLNGSGADSDGSIATFTWTKISGPAGGTIATATTATTTVNGLAAGTYVFRLTVTDDAGATAFDDVTIVVNSAPNAVPTANAGPDQNLKLPISGTTLIGSGTDSDGSIASYSWIKVSGPAGGVISAATAASTSVSALLEGTYTFRLTVTDNAGATAFDDVVIVVNPAPNQPPQANAGPDQTITLPVSEVTLSGTGTDADGTISKYQWSKISGPAGDVITSPGSATTTITSLQAGTYTYRLTVTDNKLATASDDVVITVNAAQVVNKAPIAAAGADQSITLPQSTITLTGSGTDADGSIASYQWTQISGPAASTINTASAATTTVSNLIAGRYTFRLTVTDNDAAIAFDDVVIIVNEVPNQPPVANAGLDRTVALPKDSVQLQGTGTDADGSVTLFNWSKISGPDGVVIADDAVPQTSITALAAGTYVFRLTVTDNKGATAFDDVTITVQPEPQNQAPQITLSAKQTVQLPVDSIKLSAAVHDTDGTIASVQWSLVSGPDGSVLQIATGLETEVTNLTAGIYIFRLTVTDDRGAKAFADVELTVLAAAKPPIANAGTDAHIIFPITTVTLHGTAIAGSSAIASVLWEKVSGPAGGNINSAADSVTIISNLEKGTYVFRFTATDSAGLTASDELTVDVSVLTAVDPEPDASAYAIVVAPNPSVAAFAIKFKSPLNRTAMLRITDALGQIVEERRAVARNAWVHLGAYYKPGTYYVTVVQGTKILHARLLKLP